MFLAEYFNHGQFIGIADNLVRFTESIFTVTLFFFYSTFFMPLIVLIISIMKKRILLWEFIVMLLTFGMMVYVFTYVRS